MYLLRVGPFGNTLTHSTASSLRLQKVVAPAVSEQTSRAPTSCQVSHSPLTFLSSKDTGSQGLSPENPSAKGGQSSIGFQNEAGGGIDNDFAWIGVCVWRENSNVTEKGRGSSTQRLWGTGKEASTRCVIRTGRNYSNGSVWGNHTCPQEKQEPGEVSGHLAWRLSCNGKGFFSASWTPANNSLRDKSLCLLAGYNVNPARKHAWTSLCTSPWATCWAYKGVRVGSTLREEDTYGGPYP